tara:strand:+ start:143 stop:430 length:288 start_codon:yes stop_codon:yes gene_type:complete
MGKTLPNKGGNNIIEIVGIITIFIVLEIVSLLNLFSCKTKQVECDSYSTIQIIQTDTLCIESEHVHIEEEHLCGYFDDIEIITHDTIEILIPKNK